MQFIHWINFSHTYQRFGYSQYIWPIKLITKLRVKMSGTINKIKSMSWLSFSFMVRLTREMIIARWSFFIRILLSIIIQLDIFKGAKKLFKIMNVTHYTFFKINIFLVTIIKQNLSKKFFLANIRAYKCILTLYSWCMDIID